MSITREQLEALGVPWPKPVPEMGNLRFSACRRFERRSNDQVVHHLPPSRPTRRIATAWETWIDGDGEEHETETAWRDLDDAEWAAALAAYEKVKGQTMAIVKGCAVESGEFTLENGGYAIGVLVGDEWRWNEWGEP